MSRVLNALERFADVVTSIASHPLTLAWSFVVVLCWFVGGLFISQHFQNTNYQLLINTGTTIVTFWLGFAILCSARRDFRATMLKLDTLIESIKPADNAFVGIEDLSFEDLTQLRDKIHARLDTEPGETNG